MLARRIIPKEIWLDSANFGEPRLKKPSHNVVRMTRSVFILNVFSLTTLYTIALGEKAKKDGIIVKFLNHYFNLRVISFGLAQAVVLLGTLLRLPIISSSTSLSSFALFVFYTSALGLLPVFIGGVVNRTRIQTLGSEKLQYSFSPKSRFLVIQSALLGFYLANFFIFRFSVIGEVTFLSISAQIFFRFSPYYGGQQGKGKIAQQNFSQSLGAIAGLLLIFVTVKGPIWALLSSVQQMNLIVAISCVSALIPYFAARISQRTMVSEISFSNPKKKKPFLASTTELASTLPPAALTFVDTISLQIFSSPYQLSLYGITQKLSAVATFMTGANYIKEANEVSMVKELTLGEALKRVLKFNLLNAPFLFMFTVFSPFLTKFLSSGKVSIDWILILGYLAVALVQPAWVVVANLVYSRNDLTNVLGKSILMYVIPTSILTTFAGGIGLGAPGVVFATVICYSLAIFLAARIYWKK